VNSIKTVQFSDGTIVVYDNECPDNVLCVIDSEDQEE